MDGRLSENVKDLNEKKSNELEEQLTKKFANCEKNLKARLNQFENEISNDIQTREKRIKKNISSWNQWLMSSLLRYSLAVIVGAVLMLSVLASIPWATEWWTSPTWHEGVTTYRNEDGTWLQFEPDSIEETDQTEDGRLFLLINKKEAK